MKKWLKWTLGIVAVIILCVAVLIAWYLFSFRIISGTEELSGAQSPIPAAKSAELHPIIKGEADWTSWYGPDGNHQSRVTGIATDWSGGLKKIWEVDYLCQGNGSAAWSAPVIQGNRLVICGRDTDEDLVFCLNPESGEVLWQKSYITKAKKSHGSGPRATPFIDNDRVYTFGRNGDLVCWNLFDGEQRWHKNVSDEGGEEPVWGHSFSPLVIDSLVLVQGGGDVRTIAYNKISGDIVWKSGQGLPGYAALVPMAIPGQNLVLAFHGTGLAALSTQSGTELWNVPWRTENYSSIHSDPYVIDSYLHGYSGDSFQNKGAFKCLDLSNGEEKWSTNDMGWGTCTWVDGCLLCCDIKGNIFLMQPAPDKFELITKLEDALGDIRGPVWTVPVVANGYLYLRYKQNLVCYNLVD